jgi:uncharacterized protein (DUF4415 family)
MKTKASRKRLDKLPTKGWVRDGFRKRHSVSEEDIQDMTRTENIRAAISIKVPLDVLNFFKAEAEKTGTPYQTQINDVLRRYVDESETAPDPVATLRQATRLINTAAGQIQKRRIPGS